jgi:hypothetical protein
VNSMDFEPIGRGFESLRAHHVFLQKTGHKTVKRDDTTRHKQMRMLPMLPKNVTIVGYGATKGLFDWV